MPRTKDAGFTLIETLVAFVVFALVAGAMQMSLSGGWRGVRIVKLEEAALEAAKRELAVAGHEQALVEGTTDGETADGFAWTREVRRHEGSSSRIADPSALAGYWVSVTVRWNEGPRRPEHSLTLETLKIGRSE